MVGEIGDGSAGEALDMSHLHDIYRPGTRVKRILQRGSLGSPIGHFKEYNLCSFL